MCEYIFQKYKDELKNDNNIPSGIYRFSRPFRFLIYILGSMMIFCCVMMLKSFFSQEHSLVNYVFYIILYAIFAYIILNGINIADKIRNRKNHKSISTCKAKILYKILLSEFKAISGRQIESLIDLYQNTINQYEVQEKKFEEILFSIITIILAYISSIFSNFQISTSIFICFIVIVIGSILLTYAIGVMFQGFHSQKWEYKVMVYELKEMLIIKDKFIQ